jgi:hypothetical protein
VGADRNNEPEVLLRLVFNDSIRRLPIRYLCAVLLALAIPLHAKSLYWRSLDVHARLDRAGDLHVVERQAIVFDGDWNGGERHFNVALGQDLDLRGITRIDPLTGARTPLKRGDLSQVDHYDWAKNQTVRWRSRRASDPPFSGTPLVYELDYTITNVLVHDGDTYRLDHDFAFSDRQGVIERFSLTLALDPELQPLIPTPLHWEASHIPPGESFGVHLPLRYRGAGAPASVRRGASAPVRAAVALLFIIALTTVAITFDRREKARGSFEPLPDVRVDDGWLAANLFTMRPEVAGAAWDSSTGSAEVAALLARMAQEGKLASRVERAGSVFKRDVLHLRLLVDRKQLHDYEEKLIAGLFFDGRTEVSTNDVLDHYKKSGFDPASKIRGGVEKQVRQLSGGGKRKPARSTGKLFSIPVIAAMFAAAVLLLVMSAVGDIATLPAAVLLVVLGSLLSFTPALFLTAKFATLARKRRWQAVLAVAPLLLFAAVICAFILGAFESGTPLTLIGMLTFAHPGPLLFGGIALLCVAFFTVALRNAMSTEAPESLAVRRKLLVARDFFRQQLATPNPQLRDEWYPYLLAFGLGANVDRWFASFGGAARLAAVSGSFAGGSSNSSSSSGSAWSGGGGAFGGAGASGAWAAAAGSMAAGVSAPSSGGGGGGGGGFSSGGGGGGGW